MALPFPIDGYKLREAYRTERPYLMKCMRESILTSVSEEEAKMSDLWMDSILIITNSYMDSTVSKNVAYILERNDGTKVGMIWLEISKDQFTCDGTGYLLGLYVEEEFRKQGLGKALIEFAEKWCGSQGLLSLTLNVGAYNENATSLYEKLGFKTRSVVMRKDLM